MKLYSILQFTLAEVGEEKLFLEQYFEAAENEAEAEMKVLKKLKEEFKIENQGKINELLKRGRTPVFTVEDLTEESLEEVILEVTEVKIEDFQYQIIS